MNPFVCIFHLVGGVSVQVIMPEASAKIHLRDWKDGLYDNKPFVGEDSVPGPWAVRGKDIISIQLCPVKQQQLGNQEVPNKVPPGSSGVQNK